MKAVNIAESVVFSTCCSGTLVLSQVHQCGGIDIDIEEPRRQALDDQVAHCLQLGFLVAGEALGRHLVMVALDEHRSFDSLPPLPPPGCW